MSSPPIEAHPDPQAASPTVQSVLKSAAQLQQAVRRRPLETEEVHLGERHVVRVPTAAETLRIKAYLVVQRNQVRDYLDVVALADRYGYDSSAAVLVSIDDYYLDRSQAADSVLTALVERLSAPAPRDERVTRELKRYRRLDPRWHDWATVVDACQTLADALLRKVEQK
jgi:predicted nucleotidyltransferase component of viral defense system